jgi:hypothetical protein
MLKSWMLALILLLSPHLWAKDYGHIVALKCEYTYVDSINYETGKEYHHTRSPPRVRYFYFSVDSKKPYVLNRSDRISPSEFEENNDLGNDYTYKVGDYYISANYYSRSDYGTGYNYVAYRLDRVSGVIAGSEYRIPEKIVFDSLDPDKHEVALASEGVGHKQWREYTCKKDEPKRML